MASAGICFYTEHPGGHMPCEPFDRLRRLGKYLDFKIVTMEGKLLRVHRVVLTARFPCLEQAVTQCRGRTLEWRRYSRDIVEAVVDYAYTGRIGISMNNAARLFLLATNLGNSTIISWCLEFLKPRLNMANVETFWSIANSTMNKALMSICVPVIAANFDSVHSDALLRHVTDPEDLASLLTDCRLGVVREDSKLRAIVRWFNAADKTEHVNVRVRSFKDLVRVIDFRKMSSESFIDTFTSMCVQKLPESCRECLSNAWKRVSTSGGFRLAASSKTLDGVYGTRETHKEYLITLRRVENSTSMEIFINTKFPRPNTNEGRYERAEFPRACAVAVLNEQIYVTGGFDYRRVPTALAERVDPFNGRIASVPPMTQARARHCCAVNNQEFFVFGGYYHGYLSSCEKYNCDTERWNRLPDMPTPRESSTAVSIPGVGIIVVGGQQWIHAKRSAELLTASPHDCDKWSWRKLAPMLEARIIPGAAYFNGRVVVAGGFGLHQASAECLQLPFDDSDTGQWTRIVAPKHADLLCCSLVVFEERLLLLGENGSHWEISPKSPSYTDSLNEYTWHSLGSTKHMTRVRLLVLRKSLNTPRLPRTQRAAIT